MAKQITYQPLTDIGINGLNTQDNPATLSPAWLTAADNVVLAESGRIAFRKGFKQKVAPSGTAIGSLIEHNDQGTNKIFASYGTSIYTNGQLLIMLIDHLVLHHHNLNLVVVLVFMVGCG